MTKYHYFISYQWTRPLRIMGGGVGFGHVEVELEQQITSMDEVSAIARDLERKIDLEIVVILSFQLLRVEEK